jgi:rhamnosyltransferase
MMKSSLVESTPPSPSEICGVLVTYNPTELLTKNISHLSQQIPHIILVDNGSEASALVRINALPSQHLEIMRNSHNLGIAAALNQGLQRALELGYSWAVAFDQDSCPAADLIEKLCNAYAKASYPERIAILAPHIFNLDLEKPTYYLRPRIGPFYERAYCQTGILESVSTVITSGSMINLKIYKELDGYREDFFMDYVDTEFCLRARSKGYKIVVACDARLDHVLGNRREVRVGRLRLYPTFHPPKRWYTTSRNRIAMIRMYALCFPHWFTYEIVASFYTLVRMLLTEDDRVRKLRAAWRGLLDGLRGRMGEVI